MALKKNAPPMTDYLKFWRVIRKYFLVKYELSGADLDLLLFLFSEPVFSKQKFQEFNEILQWDRGRFQRLLDEGWIVCVHEGAKFRFSALYKASTKTKRIIRSLYAKLSGEELPTNKYANPMFRSRVGYADKVYRNEIKNMNAELRARKFSDPD